MDALITHAEDFLAGPIDILVCNAGATSLSRAPLFDTSPESLAEVIDVNLKGAMLAARAAIRHAHAREPASGKAREPLKIILVDGTGAWGNATPGSAAYGASKRALTQLQATLVAEAAVEARVSKRARPLYAVHIISPGMMATDLLLGRPGAPKPERTKMGIRAINALTERPETVAAWLVPRIRGLTGTGKYIKYLTPLSAMWRLATRRGRNKFLPEN